MSESSLTPERITQGWNYAWDRARSWQARSDTRDAWEYVPGSHLAGDDRRSRPLQVSHAAQALMHAAIDHQHAVCTLVVEAHVIHTYAGATIVRAALEAASSAIWILEPKDRKERVLRTLRWNAADLNDRYNLEKTITKNTASRRDLIEAQIAPVAAQARIELKLAMRPERSTTIVAAADQYIQGTNEPLSPLVHWQLASGFAHGRRWSSLAFALREERDSTDPGSMNVRFSMTEDRLLGLVLASDTAISRAIELYELRASRAKPPAKSKRGA